MKKFIAALLLASIFVMSLQFVQTSDADEGVYITIDDIKYLIYDGTATVTGVEDPLTGNVVVPETIEYDGKTVDVCKIDSGAFIIPGIVSVTLPSTITEISDFAFRSSTLERIEVDSDNAEYCSDDGVLYDHEMTMVIKYPPEKTDEIYAAPATLVNIGSECFEGNAYLTEVWLPDSLKAIDYRAFASCISLSKMNHDGENNNLPKGTLVVNSGAFAYCENLTNLSFNESLMVIGPSTFMCAGLEHVYIPYSVSTIGESAFYSCPIKTIESDNIAYVVIDNVLYESRNNSKSLVTYPAGSEREYFEIPKGVSYIYSNAFSGCLHLKTIKLNEDLNVVTSWAFYECTSLETVKIPDSVIILEALSFYGCVNLKNIEFGNKVSILGAYCFSGTGIEEMYIPESVTSIGTGAFASCKKLKSLEIPDIVVVVDQYILYECYAMEQITMWGPNAVMDEHTLDIGTFDKTVTVSLTVHKDLEIPNHVNNEFTILNISIIGDRPYPYENLIGAAVCIAILVGIILVVREV